MTSEVSTLAELGWSNFFQAQLTAEEREVSRPVRVIAVHRSGLDVAGPDHAARGVIWPPAGADEDERATVGDWLLVDAAGRPHRRLERLSLFKRRAAGTGRAVQLIAANVNTLFIVTSCNQEFSIARLERYLALAREAAAMPVVVLTKADLADDSDEVVASARQVDRRLLVEPVDARDWNAVAPLLAWCGPGQTVALVGSSGVGKTTLINTLIGGGELATDSVRADDDKGRHTTTGRAMHRLAAGGWVIDTPGMRELQLVDVDAGLAETFADVTEAALGCRFADCRHVDEPGCAVLAAVDRGRLDPDRLTRYRKLVAEEARNSEALHERRARDRRFSKMVRKITSEKQRQRDDLVSRCSPSCMLCREPRGEESMKFGIFDHIDRRDDVPIAQAFEERLQLLELADTKDFFAYHLAEHHHTPLGTVSSPSVFIAAASQRTKNIRLCPLVYILPMYHPLRLVEEIAMLDHLTNGRFEFGVGKGISPFERAFYGVPFLDTQDIFDETFEVLVKGLTSEKLEHKGEHYRFAQAPIAIQPLQKPLPPMWYALAHEHSVPFAAEYGFNIVSLIPAEFCKPLFAAFREQFAADADHPTRQFSARKEPFIGLYRLIYVADTDEQAEKIARPQFEKWVQNFSKLWLDFGMVDVRMQGYDHARKTGLIIIGSPDSVREQIEAQAAVCDPNYMMFSLAYGNMTLAESKASMELLTDEVLPKVNA